jgi:hypothetical protein
MKLDPDERLTDELKASILGSLNENGTNGFTMIRNLWFMGRPLGVRQNILRIWRTGTCRFSAVLVNEHPIVPGRIDHLSGHLEHHDSPNLHHWLEKQNAYTTAEAFGSWREDKLSAPPRLFGSRLSRRMWFKQNFQYMPFRYLLMMAYCYLVEGAWRAGRVGRIWSKLRADVYRFHAYKLDEMRLGNQGYGLPPGAVGTPDPRVPLYERVESSAVQAAETSPAVAYHDQLAEKWDQRYVTGGFRRRADFILKEVLSDVAQLISGAF